jgi:hypothetical protein
LIAGVEDAIAAVAGVWTVETDAAAIAGESVGVVSVDPK